MSLLRFSPVLTAALLLGACVSVPSGPSVMVLPGTGKSFDQFRADDMDCRQFAYSQVGGTDANQVASESAVKSAAVGTVIGAAAGAAIGVRRAAALRLRIHPVHVREGTQGSGVRPSYFCAAGWPRLRTPATASTSALEPGSAIWPFPSRPHRSDAGRGDMKARYLTAAFVAAATMFVASVAQAQTAAAWPSKPIRWIVPFPPGGPADVVTRMLSAKLAERVGQPGIVENRAGAGGNVGHEAAAKAVPDGYTVVFVVPAIVTNPFFLKASIDPFRELAPVIHLDSASMVLLTHPSFPAKTVAEVIAQEIGRA